MEATKRVLLHGGPYHGKTLKIPLGHDHFHILEEDCRAYEAAPENPGGSREGTYSQVSGPGYRQDFEWDGWVSH